ncbi:MAG: polymerase subunit delta [Pseudomonadota bacterium]
MQIGLPSLSTHLQKGLKSLYTLHGDEALLQQEAMDAIRQMARSQGFTERSSYAVQGAHFDWAEVMNAGQSMGLFGDKQIIEIRIPTGKPGKEGSAALQRIAELSEGNDAVLTLIALPRLDKATQSSAWFASLDSFGVTIKIDPVERGALPQWIAQRLNQQNQRVQAGAEGQQALQFFADRVEGNLLAAFQEVQKLALLYPEGELSLEQIEAAVMNVARYDVFKLSEAVLAGKAERTQRMLDGLQAEGEATVLVHWALAEDIRSMKRVVDAMSAGRPLAMALRENRIWGAKEKQFERIMPNVQMSAVNKLLQAAHQVDGVVKGLKHADWPSEPWQALHRLAQMVVRVAS